MPTWPSSLPQEFEERGFQDRLPDQLARSRIEGQLPQSRRRARRSEYGPLAGDMLISAEQWRALRTFFWQTVAGGALSFDFPSVDGSGTITVAFENPPRLTPVGGDLYNVRLAFERLS